jgi:hypothetical protein
LERDENIHRRVDDRDALIRQRVDELAAEIEAERRDVPPEPKPGRPKTARGEARELVARQLGTTPDAVRVAEARALAEEMITNICAVTPTCPVETYGLPLVTDVEAEELRSVQAAVDEADQALRRAQAALKRVEGVPLFRGAQQLLARVHEVAGEVRAKRPEAVCPSCKRIPSLMGDVRGCPGCGGVGFVARDALIYVADELKLGGDQAMVTRAGKLVPYAKAAKDSAGAAPGVTGKADARTAPAGTSKRIRIENEKGEQLSPPEDDGLPF